MRGAPRLPSTLHYDEYISDFAELSMDRFHELRVFIAVAEAKGFANAAAALHNSPPAVTRAVAALEDRLGVRLFDRTTRMVHLTGFGRRFLEDARRVLVDLDTAEQDVRGEARLASGQLAITASVAFGRTVLQSRISLRRTRGSASRCNCSTVSSISWTRASIWRCVSRSCPRNQRHADEHRVGRERQGDHSRAVVHGGGRSADAHVVPVLECHAPPPVPIHLIYGQRRIVAPKVRAFVDFTVPRFATCHGRPTPPRMSHTNARSSSITHP